MAQKPISAVAVLAVAAAALLVVPLSVGGDPIPAPASIGMPNCVTSCGGVAVPYPFGIGPDASCYLPGLNLTCDDTSRPSESRLLLDTDGTLQVMSIGDVGVPLLQARRNGDVKIDVDADGNGNGTFSRGLTRDGPYSLYGQNELILTGCDVQATARSGNATVASCTSLCSDDLIFNDEEKEEDEATGAAADESVVTVQCSGGSTGCCRADIVTPGYDSRSSTRAPSGGYDVQLKSLGSNRGADVEQLPVCVFLAQHGWIDDSSVYNDLLQTRRTPSKETMAVPVWLNWEVVGGHLCKSNHSDRN